MKIDCQLDYPNFKSRVGQRPNQCHRLRAYHDIWALMAGETAPKEG